MDIYVGLRPLYRKPRLTLLLTVGATAAMALGMVKLWYDDNLLNLQPIGLESVELERKLLTETNQSDWFALSVANDAADALRARRPSAGCRRSNGSRSLRRCSRWIRTRLAPSMRAKFAR